jgi:hypothetical protein
MDLKATILAAIDQHEAEMAYTIGGLRQQVTDKEALIVAAAQRELIKDSAISDLRAQIAELTKPTTPPVVTPPPVVPTVPVSTSDYGDKAADLKAFLARPTFGTKEQALAWDRAFFGNLCGCRQIDSELTTVASLTLQDGTEKEPKIYRNLNIQSAVNFSGRKYVWLVDCKIKGDPSSSSGYCVKTVSTPATGCKVLHCTLTGAGAATVFVEGPNKAGEFEVSWCRHTNCGADAIKARHYVRCWANYVYHPMGQNVGAHTDALQLDAGHNGVDCQLMFADIPKGVAGTTSNAIAMLDGTSYDVVLKYIVANGGNYAFQLHGRNVAFDWIWYYPGSAQYGLRSGGNTDDVIGTNIFNAVSGAKIASNAK